MAGLDELIGTDVIVVHRMLKNHVFEQLGLHAYGLLTQACVDANAIDPAALGMVASTENYEGVGETDLLGPRSRTALAGGGRPRPDPNHRGRRAVHRVHSDHRRRPGRLGFRDRARTPDGLAGRDDRDQRRLHGRPARGRTTNHCMHGKDALIEEILDWRPYDYLTERITMGTPLGLVKFVASVEFEPTPDGTTVHFRFGAPKTKKELAKLESIGPAMDAMFEARAVALTAQLGAELGAVATQDAEPELPTPRPGGVLTG